jgi:hypothetical protein
VFNRAVQYVMDWDIYTWGWILWVALFFTLEIGAILAHNRGTNLNETLTAHIRWLMAIGGSFVWFGLAFLFAWGMYHFFFERGI